MNKLASAKKKTRIPILLFESYKRAIKKFYHTLCLIVIIVPTLLRGEELYTQMGFFLFREFSPLDIFIVES